VDDDGIEGERTDVLLDEDISFGLLEYERTLGVLGTGRVERIEGSAGADGVVPVEGRGTYLGVSDEYERTDGALERSLGALGVEVLGSVTERVREEMEGALGLAEGVRVVEGVVTVVRSFVSVDGARTDSERTLGVEGVYEREGVRLVEGVVAVVRSFVSVDGARTDSERVLGVVEGMRVVRAGAEDTFGESLRVLREGESLTVASRSVLEESVTVRERVM